MALKIDGVSAFFAKLTTAFNNSTVLKEGGSVLIGKSNSFFTGQRNIETSGTSLQLSGNVIKSSLIVLAKQTNSDDVYIGVSNVAQLGDGTGNGLILSPGQSISIPVTNTNLLYLNGNAGDIITYIGS